MVQGDSARPGVPLQVVAETAVLTETWAGNLAEARVAAPGVWALVEGGEHIPPERFAPRLRGRIGGGPTPSWADGSTGQFRGHTAVCRVPDAWFAPGFGAVWDDEGRVFSATVGEMLSWNPDLGVLPGVRAEGEARLFSPPADAPRLAGASVFHAKGGEFNYGHFLLDCLPSLLAVHEAGLTGAAPPLAPPLNRWRRALLDLAFPDLAVRETRAPLVRLGEAVFATSLDHYLHTPNQLLVRVRERILAKAPPATGARRVYISRRGYPMRVMVNEPAFEAALAARGFTVVRAERLSVAEQVALVRGAEVVVGPTGAGLANALFAAPGAKVFEIQPETFTSTWLRDLVHLVGADWYGYFCPAPVVASEVSWRYRIRRGFKWGYRLPQEDFLRFLDERM